MPGKNKESSEKPPILKGQEAEDAILKYLKKMNRPYGTVDVCANLKGAVPKAATQKILLALSEKGEITKKEYGKSTFFVAKQSNLEDMPKEKLLELEKELNGIEEENKVLQAELKSLTTELAKLKSTPTNMELSQQIMDAEVSVAKSLGYLEPLRAGTSLVSAEDMEKLDVDWTKWRAEWVTRKKVYMNLWHLISDSLPPKDAQELAEELGIELDTTEHGDIERGPLCIIPLKRK